MTLSTLDNIAAGMERKWGVDRLPALAGKDTRTRFDHWREKLNAAIEAGADTDHLAGIVARGWQAMDAAATALGCFPIPAGVAEVNLPGHGIVAIAHSDEAARAAILQAKFEGRRIAVWTMTEVAAVLTVHGIAHAAKHEFPGALVTTLPAEMRPGRRKAGLPEDAIPFGQPEA